MKEICNVKEFSGEDQFPPVVDLVGSQEMPEKEHILKYLKSFVADCSAGMLLIDEITGEEIDSSVNGYEDGEYYWDTRHIYHFEKYNLKLNADFIQHVIDN